MRCAMKGLGTSGSARNIQNYSLAPAISGVDVENVWCCACSLDKKGSLTRDVAYKWLVFVGG